MRAVPEPGHGAGDLKQIGYWTIVREAIASPLIFDTALCAYCGPRYDDRQQLRLSCEGPGPDTQGFLEAIPEAKKEN